MAPSPPPAPGGESFLTRKTIGGLPNWVLLAGGAVAVYILVGRKSSTGQAQATAQPSPYPANYGGGTTPVYVLPQGALGGNTGAETGIGGGVTSGQSGTPSAGTPATDGTLVGAGYSTPAPGYSQIGGAAGYQSAVQSGQTIYYEPAPGAFLPVSPAMEGGIISAGTPYTNTPTYLKTN